MPERILEWIKAFGGDDETCAINLIYENVSWYASNQPRNGLYTWNMPFYEKYKDDEPVTMFIAAHEAGHNYDKAFNRFGHYKKNYLWYLLTVLSMAMMILSIQIHEYCVIIWMIVTMISIIIMTMDVYFDEYEWTAESYALNLLGPGVALHASLVLALIAKEIRCDEAGEDGKKREELDSYFHIFRTKAYKKTVLTALNNLNMDFLGDELSVERKL